MKRLLLDTNVVVWLLLGSREELTPTGLAALEDDRNTLLVSAASVWEMAVKRSIGKLQIDDGWARELGRLDLEPLPVTAVHAAAVEHLPWHHRDPFDRLLLAQARCEATPLVSRDQMMARYDVAIVW